MRAKTKLLGDKGYQGIQNLHSFSQTPQKKPRGGKLSADDKKKNRELAKIRVVGEHVHRKLKVFRGHLESFSKASKRCNIK